VIAADDFEGERYTTQDPTSCSSSSTSREISIRFAFTPFSLCQPWSRTASEGNRGSYNPPRVSSNTRGPTSATRGTPFGSQRPKPSFFPWYSPGQPYHFCCCSRRRFSHKCIPSANQASYQELVYGLNVWSYFSPFATIDAKNSKVTNLR
jgi:hypothetical protein